MHPDLNRLEAALAKRDRRARRGNSLYAKANNTDEAEKARHKWNRAKLEARNGES